MRIHPESNTALEGLYKSSGMFCTQCRPEGSARSPTTSTARMCEYLHHHAPAPSSIAIRCCCPTTADCQRQRGGRPALGRPWEDPFKKPAYLFALVAGDLWCVEDRFTTMSAREVTLRIYVEPENIDKVQHAMDSLKSR